MTSNRAARIDAVTQAFKNEFGQLTPAQLNHKVNPQTWSIGQNIDHLIVINKTYFPIISRLREGKYHVPWIGKIGFMVNWMGNMILQSVQPDRKRKMKTFPIWQPSASDVPGDIVLRFEQHQEELKKLIAQSADLLQKGTVISSPANKNIVYTLAKAFDIIVAHEFRHLEQAREARQHLP